MLHWNCFVFFLFFKQAFCSDWSLGTSSLAADLGSKGREFGKFVKETRETSMILMEVVWEWWFIAAHLLTRTQKGRRFLNLCCFPGTQAQVKFNTVIIKNIIDRDQGCLKVIWYFKAQSYGITYKSSKLEMKHLEILLWLKDSLNIISIWLLHLLFVLSSICIHLKIYK